MTKSTRKFSSGSFSIALIFGIVFSFFILFIGMKTSSFIIQTISPLASMTLIFYCSHPLSHYIVGKWYEINTIFFFLGKSDFRKLGGWLGRLGAMLPTIGTKFNSAQVAGLAHGKRK